MIAYRAEHREELAAAERARYASRREDEAFRQRNREKVAAYKEANPSTVRETKRQEYAKNRETYLASFRAYRADHREEIAASKRRYAEEHREEIKAAKRAAYLRTRDAQLARQKADPNLPAKQAAYRSDPVHRAAAYCWHSNRRAEKYGTPGRLKAADVLTLDGPCAYCGGVAGGWDHVVPLVAGGENTLANLVPACYSCNRRKGRSVAR